MSEKGVRPYQLDLTVLPPAPSLGRVWRIGPAQASIIVGPGCRGGQHQSHPFPIIGRQRRGTYHGGGPRLSGGVQPPLAGHTHQGEEGNEKG